MNRNKLIQLVHVGAAKLFSDEDDRRMWQESRTGHTSCSNMTHADLAGLVDELFRKGALEKRPPKRAGRVPFNRSPYMAKIEAQLASMGLSWQYAERIAYNVTGGKGERPNGRPGIERLEWVRKAEHFRAIIAALDAEQGKRNDLATIDEMLKRRSKDHAHIDAMLPEQMRGKWQRNRAWLRRIINMLTITRS